MSERGTTNLTDNFSYLDKEKSKRKRGEYATDWGMVRQHLVIYGIGVTLFMLVVLIIIYILMDMFTCTPVSLAMVLPAFPIGIFSSIFALCASGVIHLLATQLFGGLNVLHELIDELHSTLLSVAVCVWMLVLLIPLFYSSNYSDFDLREGLAFPVAVIALATLSITPFVGVYTVNRVYRFGIVKASVSLVGAGMLIWVTMVILFQVLNILF